MVVRFSEWKGDKSIQSCVSQNGKVMEWKGD